MERKEVLDILAKTYAKFLNGVDFKDPHYMIGLSEGLGKFLANLHIKLMIETKKRGFRSKEYISDFISKDAQVVMERRALAYVTYEHIVPKSEYIQKVCEQEVIQKGKVEEDFIRNLLDKYLWTATITKSENRRLRRSTMPGDWDGEDIFARYKEAGIELLSYNTEIKEGTFK
jgi:hypothetical protein